MIVVGAANPRQRERCETAWQAVVTPYMAPLVIEVEVC